MVEAITNAFINAKNVLVIVGAGISTSAGIVDFRGPGGLYDIIKSHSLGLISEAEEIFDINVFKEQPELFFSIANSLFASITPGIQKPSITHAFIRLLEERGKLLRCYSQNIDSLELVAGVSNSKLVQCHGALTNFVCLNCRSKVPTSDLTEDIISGIVIHCTSCKRGLMKPDFVFFHESLPDGVLSNLQGDIERADLLLVMGTSLSVAPVSLIPKYLSHIPSILVNLQPVQNYQFDFNLLGYCDVVVGSLCAQLGWNLGDNAAATGTSIVKLTLNKLSFSNSSIESKIVSTREASVARLKASLVESLSALHKDTPVSYTRSGRMSHPPSSGRR
jgi:NAD-dependent SIR2 family protein deacetylase